MKSTVKNSPWGKIDSCEDISEHIISVTTPSHGGYGVDRKGLEKILKTFPNLLNEKPDVSEKKRMTWFEEDCEYAFVVLSFPEHFTKTFDGKSAQDVALQSLKTWYPDSYERFTNTKLAPGESFVRDKRVFEKEHENDYVSNTKFSINDDKILVFAKRKLDLDKNERSWIVDKKRIDEWEEDNPWYRPYIIDPNNDREVDGRKVLESQADLGRSLTNTEIENFYFEKKIKNQSFIPTM